MKIHSFFMIFGLFLFAFLVDGTAKFRPKLRSRDFRTKFDLNREKVLQVIANQNLTLNSDKNGIFIEPTASTPNPLKIFVEDGGMAASIDPSLNPCDDFYDFVCSGWIKANPINSYDLTENHILDLAVKVLVQYITLFADRKVFLNNRERQLMMNYVQSCSNKNSTRAQGTALFFNERRRILEKGSSITSMMIEDYPTTYIIDVGVGPDDFNSTKNIFLIKPEDPIMNWLTYTDPEYKSQFDEAVMFLRNIHLLLANDDVNHEVFLNNLTDVDRRVNNILKIDKAIAQIMDWNSPPNTTDRTLPLNELSQIVNQIDFMTYWNTVLPQNVLQKMDINETLVHVMNQGAVVQINDLLRRTDPQEIADYLDYQLITQVLPGLDERAMKIYNQYESGVFGVTQTQNTAQIDLIKCIQTAIETFSDVASAMYIQYYFPESTQEEVSSIVSNIKSAFSEMLNEESWIDAPTKAAALQKVNNMHQYIGFNPQIFNQTSINEKYASLTIPINSTSYSLDSSVAKWAADTAYSDLLKPNIPGEFDFLASDTNAYYVPSQNTIAILAGILQSPYFNISQSKAQNYGGLGSIIGHEITHGFDDYGSQFDSLGNKRNWWDNRTLGNFQNMTQCFVEQYGSQMVANLSLKVDGYRTLGENIADNGGFRAAYRAFQKLSSSGEMGAGPSATQLRKYSPNQLFFMSFAYNWCSTSRPSYLLAEVPDDEHSPNQIRVNTVIANQPDFPRLFNCPPNSRMINQKKCSLW